MTERRIENKDIFHKRTDVNEFLREHPFVSDLYDVTLQALFAQGQPQKEALRVFNQAYFICTLVTEHGVDKQDILRLIDDLNFGKDNDDYPLLGLNLMVVKCLLRVHQEILTFDYSIIKWLSQLVSDYVDDAPFSQVVRCYAGDFCHPLNFSGKYVEVPVEEKESQETPFLMIENACKLIEEAREKYHNNLDNQDARIKELEDLLRLEREKNNTLQLQLAQKANNVDTSVSECKEDAAIHSAINYATIHDYACGCSDEKEAAVISNMMSKLVMRHNVFSPKLNQLILNIDAVHKTKNAPQPVKQITCETYINKQVNNDNKDSQVFNGDIDNSQFGK